VRGPEARLVLANRAATTLFGAIWAPGQPLQEFLAQHNIRFLRPDGRPLEPEQLPSLRVMQRRETIRQQQLVIWHADETSLPVLVNAVPLDAAQLPGDPAQATTGSGEPERAALVVYQDVTALIEAEALKDEFLSIATHELRSPLAVLKGYAEMLLRQASRGRGTPLTDWQQEGLQGITQAATRLSDLTADLLDVTRLQAERPSQPSETTDLVALAERVVKRQQVTTQRHHLTFQTAYAHLVANIDVGRMEQVLTNVLSNAIKYSPQGGPIEITIGEDEETGEAVFSIQDHGMGIPIERHAQIFGRFVRADNARASEIVGTGLGLYLCHEHLERYGGRIWFESAEGAGSTFFVALPVVMAYLATPIDRSFDHPT
jgi:signal transduction histidine kinase